MPRIPIAAIPNAPQGAAMPTGEAAGRGVNFMQAAAMMRGGATKEVMEQLKSVLKCAAVLDVQAKCSVSASERSELYMLFQAGQLSGGGDNVERQAQLELLKSTLGLTGAGVLA